MVGHVSPEAFRGGPLAALQEGDVVVIDVAAGEIRAELPDGELEHRLAGWKQPPARVRAVSWRSTRRSSPARPRGGDAAVSSMGGREAGSRGRRRRRARRAPGSGARECGTARAAGAGRAAARVPPAATAPRSRPWLRRGRHRLGGRWWNSKMYPSGSSRYRLLPPRFGPSVASWGPSERKGTPRSRRSS